MSTTFILERLEKINSLGERRKEAVRLFNCFENYIPSGGFNPPIFAWDLSDESIKKNNKWADDFYENIKKLCGGKFPKEIKSVYEKFEKNKIRTEYLLSLSWEGRRSLKIWEKFPYWDNFDSQVHNHFKNCWKNIDLEKITFLPKMINQGGFAEIYEAVDDKGEKYALKLFYNHKRFLGENQNFREQQNIQISKNLFNQKELFFQEPFAMLRAIPRPINYREITCYLMDFISGKSVKDSLEEKVVFTKEDIGRILITYSQMLNSLHNQGKLFADNNWGAVIINKDEVKICDYDLVVPAQEIKEGYHPFQLDYGSYEHYLNKKLILTSDLEQFALMTDHLLMNECFLVDTYDKWRKNEEMAKQNVREYPKERMGKLPKKLKEIIPALITYPRDNSIISADFVDAIKQDYKL